MLYPLVSAGDAVSVGEVVTKKGLIPVRNEQTVIDFEIFRTSMRIPDPRTEPDTPRTMIGDDAATAASAAERASGAYIYGRIVNPIINKKDRICVMSVPIEGVGRPRNERVVDLDICIGSTEMQAVATSRQTGSRTEVAFRFDV